MDQSMGLHYGIWEKDTPNIQEAILNVNRRLITLGKITSSDYVLDAGCGIGGSSIFLAKHLGCKTHGITLSAKQVHTAQKFATKNGVGNQCSFSEMDYTKTSFEDNTFDVVWAIESFGSAQEKHLFFKEMSRILKPKGRIVMADTFKPEAYSIAQEKEMQTMLHGWAISDILSLKEVETLAKGHAFDPIRVENVSQEIARSVRRLYYAAWLGMIGTKAYNLFKNASPFSKIHYKTGLAQKKAFDQNKWGYYLISFTNNK